MQSTQLVTMHGSDPASTNGSSGALVRANQQLHGLYAPVMELTGHAGEVFATRFDATGELIVSGSMDSNIFLWKASGHCENYGILKGHKAAVLDLHWSRDSRALYSASADMHLASWDLETGTRIRRHPGHEEVINCMDVSKRGGEILFSASDDGCIGIWDPRQKDAADFMETSFPVTALAIAEAGNELFTGGIDNDISVWDLRKKSVAFSMSGHSDTITSLAVSADSQVLLSNSFDNTVRTWDIRPFASSDSRALKTYDGSVSGPEKNLYKAVWDATGKRIAAAAGDGTAIVWEASSGKLINKVPGHKGAVNDVRFSPSRNLLLTASTDKSLILGELVG